MPLPILFAASLRLGDTPVLEAVSAKNLLGGLLSAEYNYSQFRRPINPGRLVCLNLRYSFSSP